MKKITRTVKVTDLTVAVVDEACNVTTEVVTIPGTFGMDTANKAFAKTGRSGQVINVNPRGVTYEMPLDAFIRTATVKE